MTSNFTLKKCNSENLPDNVIGAAVLVENDAVPHAGIIIRYNGVSKLFHFDGQKVLLEEFNDYELYFFNEFPFINTSLAPAFLAHCEIVLKEARPTFGFFYIGSQYDSQGKFRSPGDLPEYMTCVGFCLSFLKYFHEGKDLFNFNEWNVSSLDRGEEYINKFIEKVKKQHPEINIEDFEKGIRRIWPAEYYAGTYSPNIPVGKAFIDTIVDELKIMLINFANGSSVNLQ
jgi:hypothetical protein